MITNADMVRWYMATYLLRPRAARRDAPKPCSLGQALAALESRQPGETGVDEGAFCRMWLEGRR